MITNFFIVVLAHTDAFQSRGQTQPVQQAPQPGMYTVQSTRTCIFTYLYLYAFVVWFVAKSVIVISAGTYFQFS